MGPRLRGPFLRPLVSIAFCLVSSQGYGEWSWKGGKGSGKGRGRPDLDMCLAAETVEDAEKTSYSTSQRSSRRRKGEGKWVSASHRFPRRFVMLCDEMQHEAPKGARDPPEEGGAG